MEALFEALINAWCRLLVAASPLLFGSALGALLYYLVGGGTFGLVLLVAAAVAGLIAGVLWSSRIARRGELIEYSSGMPVPPAKDAANETADGTPKTP